MGELSKVIAEPFKTLIKFFMKTNRLLLRGKNGKTCRRCIFWGSFSIVYTSVVFAADQVTLLYSTNPLYPPYDWSVGKDSFDGASIELLEMVVPPGVKLVPIVVPWKRALAMAEIGEIDILVSLRITPERSRFLEFTTHRAFPNPIVLFTRKDKNMVFNEWADLKKYIGGVSFGDTFGNGFDEYMHKELKFEKANSMVNNFRKLDSERIDYFVSSYYMGMAYLASHKLNNPIIALEPAISSNDIHFGFSKKSEKKAMIAYISKKLEEADKNGVPEQLLKKYLEKYKANPKTFKP